MAKKYVWVRVWKQDYEKLRARAIQIKERTESFTGIKVKKLSDPHLLHIFANTKIDAPPEKIAKLVYVKKIRKVKK